MDTPTIKKKIENIETKFRHLENENKSYFHFLSNSHKKYVLIFVLVFFTLIILRPDFLYENDDLHNTKFSYKKLFLYVILISFVLIIFLFAYNYNKDKK